MVALRTSVFVSESNKVQPKKRVCVKQESIDSDILLLVRLLSGNIGQCRRKWEIDSILEAQLQRGLKQF